MPIDFLPSPGRKIPPAGRTAPTSWSGRRRSFPTHVRKKILQLYPTCNWPGCNRTSDVADHVVPHAEAVRMGWSQEEIDSVANGQGLCHEHHDLKTKEEQRRGRIRVSRKRQRETHPAFRRN